MDIDRTDEWMDGMGGMNWWVDGMDGYALMGGVDRWNGWIDGWNGYIDWSNGWIDVLMSGMNIDGIDK